MIRIRSRTALRLAGALACVAGGAALAQGLAALDRLEPGLWELRMREAGRSERICVPDGRRLIQLRHPQAACRQFLVEDEANAVTVHYTCSGHGAGRTRLRVESPRLVQLESSGVADKQPFDIAGEARRVGACSSS